MQKKVVPKLESESKSNKNWARSPLPNLTQHQRSTDTMLKTKNSKRFEKKSSKRWKWFPKIRLRINRKAVKSERDSHSHKNNMITYSTLILRPKTRRKKWEKKCKHGFPKRWPESKSCQIARDRLNSVSSVRSAKINFKQKLERNILFSLCGKALDSWRSKLEFKSHVSSFAVLLYHPIYIRIRSICFTAVPHYCQNKKRTKKRLKKNYFFIWLISFVRYTGPALASFGVPLEAQRDSPPTLNSITNVYPQFVYI